MMDSEADVYMDATLEKYAGMINRPHVGIGTRGVPHTQDTVAS